MPIREATTADDLDAVRALCWAYRQVLLDRTAEVPGIVEHYYAEVPYRAMMDALPGRHVAPNGIVLVATTDAGIVACGMTQRVDPDTCELKRVFVAPAARGQGLARQLCEAAVDWAAAAGYRRIVLDTIRSLTEAVTLYRSMGFQDCDPYHALPPAFAPHVLFFEKPLAA